MSAPHASFWAALPLGRGVALISHDRNGVAAFSKPAGVLSHPNSTGDQPRALLTVPYRVEGEFFEWKDAGGVERRLWLLNRLDSATSGVILAAGVEDLAAAIRTQFRLKQVRKIYVALVFGRPSESKQIWRDKLSTEKRAARIRTGAGHIPSECHMSIMRAGQGEPRLTLIRLDPRTGRSHQLRVQCARRNLPIVGDQTYGDFRRNRAFARVTGNKRLFLHSLESGFDYEYAGAKNSFKAAAPVPVDFEGAL